MQGVAEAESRRAADAAEQAYRAAFDRRVSADEAALDAEHVRALATAQAVFSEAAVGEAFLYRMPRALRTGGASKSSLPRTCGS